MSKDMEQATKPPTNQSKPRPSYINPFIQDNVIMGYARGLSYHQIARETGVNRATISKLLKTDAAQTKLSLLKSNLADKIEEIARKMLFSISDSEIPTISPAQRMTCVGIAVDKMQLLRNKPTEIVSSEIPTKLADMIAYVLIDKTQEVVKNKVVDTTECDIKLT